MSYLSPTELRKVEKKHAIGISSADIVALFKSKSERFSEATLRKYVQLGLLPTSRRVGAAGLHRGSRGVYPVETVRLVNDIKKALDQGLSLDDLRLGREGLLGELQGLRRTADHVFDRFKDAIKHSQDGAKKRQVSLRQDLDKQRKAFIKQLDTLKKLADRLSD